MKYFIFISMSVAVLILASCGKGETARGSASATVPEVQTSVPAPVQVAPPSAMEKPTAEPVSAVKSPAGASTPKASVPGPTKAIPAAPSPKTPVPTQPPAPLPELVQEPIRQEPFQEPKPIQPTVASAPISSSPPPSSTVSPTVERTEPVERIDSMTTQAVAPPKIEGPQFSDIALRKDFENDLIAGKVIEGDEKYGAVDEWAKAVEKAGDLDGAIERLTAAAGAPNAPPQVNLALAALYGRKGLIQKQYAALVSAEKAAKTRPDVVFSLSAVYGRKDILKASYSADELLVGSFQIFSEPSGIRVLIDGKDYGTTPRTIEKLKEGTHRARLESADYFPWESPFEVITGQETAITAKLGIKPGSVEVAIGPIGIIRLDEGPWEEAPHTFDGIEPGEHTISINPILYNNRFYDFSGTHTVTVLPDKKVVFNKTFPIGRSKLQIRGAPEGSFLYIDDRRSDSAAFTNSVEVDSGVYTVRVVSPIGQEWYQKNITVFPGGYETVNLSQMIGFLARKTIKLDGKVDSWGNLRPYAESSNSSFMGDQAYGIKGVYMCRDERYLYWRVDFQSKNPLNKVPAGTDQKIQGVIIGNLKGGGHIDLSVGMDRIKNQTDTWFGIVNKDNKFFSMGERSNLTYRGTDRMFVARLLYSTMATYLNGPLVLRFAIANVGNDRWLRESSSNTFTIDFSK